MTAKNSLKMPLVLWFVATLFFAFQFILRMSAGILREDIMQKFNLDTIAFGSLAGYYYLGYAGMQIPIGIMLDRFNFKYVTVGAILIAVFGTLTFVFADNIETVMIGRFLIGAGSAAGILSVAKIIQLYFPGRLHSLMMGFSFSLGLTGAVFGGLPMKIIFNDLGYDKSFIMLAIIAIVIAIIIISVRDKNISKNDISLDEKPLEIYDLMRLIFQPKILFIGIFGGLMVGSLEGFGDVWSIPFFNQVYGFSENQSIFLASIIFIGMIFGGPILGYLGGTIGSINLMVFFIGILNVMIFGVLFYFNSLSYSVVFILMFLLGILCCYQALVFTIVGDLVDKSKVAVAIAIINCINMSFGHLFHKVISYIMQTNWDGALNDVGSPIYTHHNYILGLSIIPIMALIGSIGFLYLSYSSRKLSSKS